MIMKEKNILIIFSRLILWGLMVCVMSFPLQAGNPVPGLWGKVAVLKNGDHIRVSTETGLRLDGQFRVLTEKYLEIYTVDDKTVKVNRFDIAEIYHYIKTGSSVKNGILIGSLAGVGVGGVFVATVVNDESWDALGTVLYTAVFTGLGAIIGGAAGAAYSATATEMIYISETAAMRKEPGR